MAQTFNERENKVFNFMEQVRLNIQSEEADNDYKNSLDYKYKLLNKGREDCKQYCLHRLMGDIYKDATPLSPEYKQAYSADMIRTFDNFINNRCPQGLEFYVREGLKKNSPFAKRVLEAVEELVNNEYAPKEFDIENQGEDDLIFKSSDDLRRRIDIDTMRDLNTDDLTDYVDRNVIDSIRSEIVRAKKLKEELKNKESELANNINVTTQDDVNNAMEMAGLTGRDYEPSLFEAIMINKVNNIDNIQESKSDINTYNALSRFGFNNNSNSSEELAFIEAVKEYTALNVVKALKLESFDMYKLNDMIYNYSKNS